MPRTLTPLSSRTLYSFISQKTGRIMIKGFNDPNKTARMNMNNNIYPRTSTKDTESLKRERTFGKSITYLNTNRTKNLFLWSQTKLDTIDSFLAFNPPKIFLITSTYDNGLSSHWVQYKMSLVYRSVRALYRSHRYCGLVPTYTDTMNLGS